MCICACAYIQTNIFLGNARTITLIQFKTLCLFDNFELVLLELLQKNRLCSSVLSLSFFFSHADQSYSNSTNAFLFYFIHMHVLSFRSRLILFACHKVLFSLVSFVSCLWKYFHCAIWLHSSMQTMKCNCQDCSPQILQIAAGDPKGRNAMCVARGVQVTCAWL